MCVTGTDWNVSNLIFAIISNAKAAFDVKNVIS